MNRLLAKKKVSLHPRGKEYSWTKRINLVEEEKEKIRGATFSSAARTAPTRVYVL